MSFSSYWKTTLAMSRLSLSIWPCQWSSSNHSLEIKLPRAKYRCHPVLHIMLLQTYFMPPKSAALRERKMELMNYCSKPFRVFFWGGGRDYSINHYHCFIEDLHFQECQLKIFFLSELTSREREKQNWCLLNPCQLTGEGQTHFSLDLTNKIYGFV